MEAFWSCWIIPNTKPQMTGEVSKFLRAKQAKVKHAHLAIYLFRYLLSFRVAALPVYFAPLKLSWLRFYTLTRFVNLVSIQCIDLKEKLHDRSIKSRQHKIELRTMKVSFFLRISTVYFVSFYRLVAVDKITTLSFGRNSSLLRCLHLTQSRPSWSKSKLHLRDRWGISFIQS